MGYLEKLLPEPRELRAPLVAGSLWLLAAWLALEPQLPPREAASGIYESILALEGVVSAVGAAFVLIVVSYFVGSISVDLTRASFRWIRPDEQAPAFDAVYEQLKEQEKHAYARLAAAEIPSELWPSPPDVKDLVTDMSWLRVALMMEKPDLSRELDRLDAQIDVKLAAVPPLIALGAVVAFRAPAIASLAVLGIAVLIAARLAMTAISDQRNLNQLVQRALSLGLVTPPALDRYNAEVYRALIEGAQPPGRT